MAAPTPYTPTMISGSTVFAISRASYYFAGPDSPANRRYNLADVEGLFSVGPIVGAPWSVFANIYLGTPALGVSTYVVDAQAASGAGSVPLNSTNEGSYNGIDGGALVVAIPNPRALTYVSSSADDTTQTVTVYGYDQYSMAMTEQVTLNGVTSVPGLKAFQFVASVVVSASLAGDLSVGTSAVLGLPVAVDPGSFEAAVKVVSGVQSADAGTFAPAIRTVATISSGDVRGTYAPAVALNGADGIYVRAFPAIGGHLKSTSTYGVAQF